MYEGELEHQKCGIDVLTVIVSSITFFLKSN